MTSAQREKVREAVAKRSLVPFLGSFGVGAIDLVKAWHKHDMRDMLVTALVFFLVVPLFILWIRKSDWTR
jgi:hypothetical protein